MKKERDELDNPMDKLIEIWLLDFLNMVFGAGPGSKEFWEDIVIPQTAVYYTEAQYGDLTKQQEVLLQTINDL